MDLRGINVFIEVAELKSFTRAAEKLGYSQPTVSFQIKQLETELGVALFDRIGHTISLTQAGRDVLVYAQQIRQLSQEMLMAADEPSNPRGLVRIGLADSLCAPLVQKHFHRFHEMFPDISVQLLTGGTQELLRMVDHNLVDLICTLDSHVYDTNYVIAHEEKIDVHFIASVRHPLAMAKSIGAQELSGQDFLLTEKGMSYRRLLDEWMASHSLELHPVLEMGGADLICRLVDENAGISFLPDYVTEQVVRQGRVVRLPVSGIEIDLWKQLIYRSDKWVSPPMRAVIGHLSGISLISD